MEIEKKTIERKFEEVTGLGTFFSTGDHDELRATSDLIPMNTLVFDVQTVRKHTFTKHDRSLVVG